MSVEQANNVFGITSTTRSRAQGAPGHLDRVKRVRQPVYLNLSNIFIFNYTGIKNKNEVL